MSKTSTNALTKRYAESKGWLCDTVQRFYGGKRHDLFGIIDSIVIIPGPPKAEIYFIQNCSYGSLKGHQDAIDDTSTHVLDELMEVGTFECWEWRRRKAKRGGKRIARHWHLRRSTATPDGWTGPEPWSLPLDLYPK